MKNLKLRIKQQIKGKMSRNKFTRNLATRIAYFHNSGRFLNLRSPKTWSEKLLWLNKYWQPELKSICADKYAVRDFVKNKGFENILIPLLGVWKDANDIDFNSLPKRFVLKCNHGCGWNIICEDKEKLNIEKSRAQLNRWMKIDLGEITSEIHYHYIKPYIICEEFLPIQNYSELKDFKIHCFNGKPEFIGVCYDRDLISQNSKGAIFSTNWERLCYLKEDDVNEIVDVPKPEMLDEMLKIATSLSENIPYVRVDLYAIGTKVFFGELTFTPDGNILDREYKYEVVKKMGEYITLPDKITRK